LQAAEKPFFVTPALNEVMSPCPELDSGYFRITAFNFGIFD
jgi:hypothetical protein